MLDGQGVLRVGQRVVRLDQERVEVGHVPRDERVDLGEQAVAGRAVGLANSLERDVPDHPGVGVDPAPDAAELHHADHVGRPEPLDGELGDVLLPLVAVGHFGGVHDEHQPPLPRGLEGFDLAIDRQRGFDRRTLVAARAEPVRPADHDQPAALVVDLRADHLGLVGGEPLVGDVGQNHRVVVRQKDPEFALVGRQFIGRQAVHAQLALGLTVLLVQLEAQRLQEVIVARRVRARQRLVEQQDAALTAGDDGRFDAVVLDAIPGQPR